MGADIHIYVERAVGGKWVTTDCLRYPSPGMNRNYRRFAALAGVRGGGPEPRGLPPQVGETTQYHIDRWDGDGHSHSWLPMTEASAIFLSTQDDVSADSFESEYPASHFFGVDGDIEEYRIVFFFDN